MLLSLLLWACDKPILDSGKPEVVEESPIWWDECSYNGGDHICDLSLTKADGGFDNLYSYYGEVIVVDVSAMWCGPCQEAAWNSNSIKVTSGGLFFNALDVEKKMERINNHKTTFFRPFNSVFERELHSLSK